MNVKTVFSLKALAVGALLFVSSFMHAAASQSSGQFSIVITPAAKLIVEANNVDLKIRLAKGATAVLWAADDCAIPEDGVTITRSGQYHFAVSDFAKGRPAEVCVVSSDGTARDSAPLRGAHDNSTEGN
jgi:hypothetical protein